MKTTEKVPNDRQLDREFPGLIKRVAREAGVEPATLRKMLRSATWDTRSESYKRVAKAMGMTPEQMTAKWKEAGRLREIATSAGGAENSNAQFPRQLQPGQPVPILQLLERLYRIGCDVASAADIDEGEPKITIEGVTLETDKVSWRHLSQKLDECEGMLLQMIQHGIGTRTSQEYNDKGPAVPIFNQPTPGAAATAAATAALR